MHGGETHVGCGSDQASRIGMVLTCLGGHGSGERASGDQGAVGATCDTTGVGVGVRARDGGTDLSSDMQIHDLRAGADDTEQTGHTRLDVPSEVT